MINAVGREIPDEILRKYGKEPFSGVHYRDNKPYKKAEVTARGMVDPMRNKMVSSIREALEKCRIMRTYAYRKTRRKRGAGGRIRKMYGLAS